VKKNEELEEEWMDWKGSREKGKGRKGKRKMGETINRKSDGRGNGRTRREERRGGVPHASFSSH